MRYLSVKSTVVKEDEWVISEAEVSIRYQLVGNKVIETEGSGIVWRKTIACYFGMSSSPPVLNRLSGF